MRTGHWPINAVLLALPLAIVGALIRSYSVIILDSENMFLQKPLWSCRVADKENV